MPFNRPTLPQLIARVQSDIESRLPNVDAKLRRKILNAIAFSLSNLAHGLHGHLDFLSKQILPDTAEAEYLKRRSTIWNIPPKPSIAATGNIIFTGTDSSVVPAGTVLQRLDGVEFTTASDVTIVAGSATVSVTANETGTIGNTDPGSELSLISPIAGVNSTATVDASGLIGGVDAESDDSLRARLLERIQQAPHGGAKHDYVAWAREVSGVTRAWSYPLYTGEGTVGVTFVLDDQAGSIIPDAAKVTEVQTYIDARRPVTAAVTVFAPIAVPLDLTIALTPNTAAVQAAVQAELTDLLRRDAEPGATILLSRINEVISIAEGETDHVVSVPAVDVIHAADEIAVLGAITWA